MNYLIPVTVATLITLVVVSGRSAYLPESTEKKLDSGENQKNVVVLEVPDLAVDSNIQGKGDKHPMTEKNFTSMDESVNILDEEEARSSHKETTESEFSLVVPVARNFSSLKELFEILREDTGPRKEGGANNQTYVKGTEAKGSDYMIFFAS